MDSHIETAVADYRSGTINRRVLLDRLTEMLGSYASGQHFLETSGLAMSLLSPTESELANVTSLTVNYSKQGIMLAGYLSRSKGELPSPAVILVHQNRGLNEHIRDVARRLASQGYATLAVDLLSSKGGTSSFATPEDATKALQNLRNEDVIGDLDAAYDYLNSNGDFGKDDIAIMGFCWGGQRAFLYATANPRLKAAVVFYGSPPPDEKLANIQCPVLASYGEKDLRITSTVPTTQEKMQQLGKSYQLKIYPAADHAFFDDTGNRYDDAAAKEAWIRVCAFLQKNLRIG